MTLEAHEALTLDGQHALILWRQGKYKWNEWVQQNPDAKVDFSGIDFNAERTENQPEINFSEYIFPIGGVNFSNASFGDGPVDFLTQNFLEMHFFVQPILVAEMSHLQSQYFPMERSTSRMQNLKKVEYHSIKRPLATVKFISSMPNFLTVLSTLPILTLVMAALTSLA